MDKEKIIRRIEQNYNDMADALKNNNMPSITILFRDYTDEIVKIINEAE